MNGRSIATMLLICTLWASVGVAIKFSLDSAPPLGLAAVRMSLAAAALWLWMRMRAPAGFSLAHGCVVLVAAFFYCLLLAFTHLGFNHTSAARGIVLLNTTPIFVAVLAHFVSPHEPLGLAKSSGLILAFAGVVTIFAHRLDSGSAAGDALMLLAAISWALQTLWSKRAAKDVDPAGLTLVQFIGAASVLSAISALSEPLALWRPSPALGLAIVYLAIPGTVFAWVLWFRLLKYVPASTASAFIFTVPLIGVVLSALLLGEPITLQFALGAALVSAGIVIVNLGSAFAGKLGPLVDSASVILAPIAVRAVAQVRAVERDRRERGHRLRYY